MITWLLINATASPVPTPVSEVPSEETSGDELNVPTSCTFSASSNWESKIKVLIHEVTELQGQKVRVKPGTFFIQMFIKVLKASAEVTVCRVNTGKVGHLILIFDVSV